METGIKKKLSRMLISLFAIVAVFAVAGVFVACGGGTTNTPEGGVDDTNVVSVTDIEMGYTHAQVKSVLGEPYVGFGEDADNTLWRYYDDSYVNVASRIDSKSEEMFQAVVDGDANKATKLTNEIAALEKQLEMMTFKYIEIHFTSKKVDGSTVYVVSDVLYDSVRNAAATVNKSVDQVKLSTNKVPAFSDMSYVKVSAKITYTDGSYKNTYLNNSLFADLDTFYASSKNFTWTDSWGSYSATISVDINIAENTVIESNFGSGKFTATAMTAGTLYDVPDFSVVIESESETLGGDGDYTIWNKIKSSVTDITIDGEVTEIAANTFAYLTRLTSITLPDELTTIGASAFKGCNNLLSITIPESVTTIGEDAFASCNSIATVSIPLSFLAAVPKTNIKDLTLTGSGNIADKALENYTALESITIGKDVRSIVASVFKGCTNLASITVDEKNTAYQSVGNCLIVTRTKTLIVGCKTSVIPDDDTVVAIESYAFSYTGCPQTVVIPSSVTTIGSYAFYSCSDLISVTISDGVTTIENNAFNNCTNLAEIDFPDSVTSIGSGAFSYTAYYDNDDNWENDVLYMGKHLVKAKSTLSGEYSIKQGTLYISAGAFYGCHSITSLTIPESITYIGDEAFNNCSKLTTVNWNAIAPEVPTGYGTGYIFFDSFYGTALTTLNLGDKVETIPTTAFYGCRKLLSVTIPQSVTSIGYDAFGWCDRLVEVYNLSELSIVKDTFEHGGVASRALDVYSSLDEQSKLTTTADGYVLHTDGDDVSIVDYNGDEKELTLPSNVTAINSHAFYEHKLTGVIIPDSVTSIGSHAFYESRMTSVTIGNSVKTIGSSAFARCNFTTVVIPNSVETIESYAFYDCRQLETVTIGSGVKEIKYNAFTSCFAINKVNYRGNSAAWDKIKIGSSNDYLVNASRTYIS